MAKQPEDLVVRILRDIQATLAEHSARFEQIDQRFDRVDQQLDELRDGMVTALGLSTHAHVRTDGIKKEIEDIKKRLKRLEGKR